MAAKSQLALFLELPEQCDEEEITSTLVALLTAAIHDEKPARTLRDLRQIIATEGGTSYLDPLNMLPLLLPCNDPTAMEIISLIGECGPAKEVVIAVQEATERLERSFEVGSDSEGELDKDQEKEKGYAKRYGKTHEIEQLAILIDLYASAIPRMKLRQKPASEVIKPLFDELVTILKISRSVMTRNYAEVIITNVAKLARGIRKWTESTATDTLEEEKSCPTIVKELLDRVTLSCAPLVQGSVAQRALEECFPRYAFRSQLGTDWKAGDAAIHVLLDAYQSFNKDLHTLSGSSSATHLIAWAYQPSYEVAPNKLVSFLLPPLISSLQSNTFLDESLAILIRALHTWQKDCSKRYLPAEIIAPLASLLPAIASVHPDPIVRHQTFRVLSLLLASSDPKLQFQQLVELAGHSEFPQMRVAAVGLVKEGLLQSLALSGEKGKDEPFLGPLFLRTFGPILFRPNPPDLFTAGSNTLDMKTFQETSEPARLVECLSLYYVLLQRDEGNLTGIRDKDVLKNIENNLLMPLRHNLTKWMDDPAVEDSQLHDITPIVSLKISLERIDAAKVGLGGS